MLGILCRHHPTGAHRLHSAAPPPCHPPQQNPWDEDWKLRMRWHVWDEALQALGVPADIGGRGTKEWHAVPLAERALAAPAGSAEALPAVLRHPGHTGFPSTSVAAGGVSPAVLGWAALVFAGIAASASAGLRRQRGQVSRAAASTARKTAINLQPAV